MIIKPSVTITGDGTAPNLLTDLRDVGRFVARIIKDDRTLNKFVFTYSDALSQNEIFAMIEEMSGEKIEREYVSTFPYIPFVARSFVSTFRPAKCMVVLI